MSLSAICPVTIEQLREWVLTDASETSKDELLAVLANAAIVRIERGASRLFVARDLTEVGNGDGAATVVRLHGRPVNSVATFTIDDVAVEATGYAIDAAGGYLRLKNGARVSQGAGNVVVVYNAGYAVGHVALSDVAEITLSLTKRLYQLKAKGGQSFQSVTLGGNSYMMRDALSTDLLAAIARLTDTRFG